MIYLALRAPGESPLRPILREEGFSIQAVNPLLPLPLQTGVLAREAGFNLLQAPTPDFLLANQDRHVILIIECKLSSFGPDLMRRDSQQAMSFLALNGPHVADFMGWSNPDRWKTHLLYIVTGGSEELMDNTLKKLSEHLRTTRISPSSFNAVGVDVREDGIYLVPAHADGVLECLKEDIKVLELEEGENPRLLYLIPLDVNINRRDEYGNRALQERIRIGFLETLGRQLDKPDFEVDLEEMMSSAFEIWDILDRDNRRYYRNRARTYLRREIEKIRELTEGYGVRIEDLLRERNKIRFTNLIPQAEEEIRKYLSSSEFRRGSISESPQMEIEWDRIEHDRQ
jgi:hypothetical protein